MLETYCKNCVFKILNSDNVQTGCSLNRTSLLPINRIQNGCFVLGRFCNTNRPDEWLQSLSFEESQKSEEIVLEEVVPRIGFFVKLDTSVEDPMKRLESSILDIVNQETYKARYVIISNDKVEYNQEIQALLTKYFDFEQTKYHITQIVEKPLNDNLLIDESSGLFLNGWLYVTTSGQKINTNFIKKFNDLINFKMRSISIILPYDEFNGLVFQTALFKFLCGNRKRRIDDENFDNRPFLEKAKDLQSSEKTIFSWEEINAS